MPSWDEARAQISQVYRIPRELFSCLVNSLARNRRRHLRHERGVISERRSLSLSLPLSLSLSPLLRCLFVWIRRNNESELKKTKLALEPCDHVRGKKYLTKRNCVTLVIRCKGCRRINCRAMRDDLNNTVALEFHALMASQDLRERKLKGSLF